jgi:hypothetical protein
MVNVGIYLSPIHGRFLDDIEDFSKPSFSFSPSIFALCGKVFNSLFVILQVLCGGTVCKHRFLTGFSMLL